MTDYLKEEYIDQRIQDFEYIDNLVRAVIGHDIAFDDALTLAILRNMEGYFRTKYSEFMCDCGV